MFQEKVLRFFVLFYVNKIRFLSISLLITELYKNISGCIFTSFGEYNCNDMHKNIFCI